MVQSRVVARNTEQRIPTSYSTSPRENGLDESTLNDVESLKKGTIKTSANKSYTILLVGETGVGKSSVMELIANVLVGNDINNYNFNILDRANERGGSNNQSQTNSTRLYEHTSNNGVTVRILDTPGLADTHGIEQDELRKKSIITQIQSHTNSVTAVLVLTNGTVPRVTAGTNYALSTLSAIFPISMAANIASLFTNVSSPLYLDFSRDTAPDILNCGPHFLINNPIALQKKYLKLKNDRNRKTGRTHLRGMVKADEQGALDMLVDLFDWLDGLEPQPTTWITPLYVKPQAMVTDAHARIGQALAKRAKHPASRRWFNIFS